MRRLVEIALVVIGTLVPVIRGIPLVFGEFALLASDRWRGCGSVTRISMTAVALACLPIFFTGDTITG